MVMKLQQIERLLKDLARKRKQKPKDDKAAVTGQRRRSSVSSTASAFMNRLNTINRKQTIKNEMITEGDEDQDSDNELLSGKDKTVVPQKSILKKQATTASKSFDTRGAYKPSASFTNARI